MPSDLESRMTSACDRYVTDIVLMAIVLAFVGCVRALVPSGKPGCARGHQWSDSAQRCIPRDGAR